MKELNLKLLTRSLLKEIGEEKWQVIFRGYNDDNDPYTEKLFDTEAEAEDFALSQEWEEDYQDYDGGWHRRYRYYNPQENDSYFGYEIEKVQ